VALETSYSLKMTVFWDVALCSLIKIDRCSRDAYYLHHQGLLVEVVSTAVTSVSFIIVLMMEAVSSSENMSICVTLHGAAFPKAAVFILVALRT
jgi:hypothetical protein